jgi:uncharacterized protein
MYNVYAGGDYMVIDLLRLKNNIDETIELDSNIEFSNELLESSELLAMESCHVKGFLSKDTLDEISISLNIDGIMVLPCAITLKPVKYPFNTSIEGNLQAILAEMGEITKKVENSIDILPIIWENVLMEIPLKVVSEDVDTSNLKGEGWKLVTEDADDINPELAKLKDLL